MPTHPQIVVAAPDRHLRALPPCDRVILSEREDLGTPVHCLEDTICVVPLLVSNLLTEEAIVVVAGGHCRDGNAGRGYLDFDLKSLKLLYFKLRTT